MRIVSVPALAALLNGAEEVALIDLREQGLYARGHLLFARSVPLSTLELRIGDLVPRKDTAIVLCGEGDRETIESGVEKLRALGYSDVSVQEGGNAAWTKAGHRIFGGIYVPSKAFGEVVEHYFATPNVTPEQLREWIDNGRPIRIFDSRPPDEFKRMSIPGAVDCPGAELVYRVPDLLPSDDTIVVVNCAGRTRSIIGAQSLINAGIPNPVYALRNGTMGWELAGFSVDRGKEIRAPAPSPGGALRAEEMAMRFASKANVREIDWADYQQLKQDDSRTCYLFDVRSDEEFLAGHVLDAVHAPGGQLVQATDSYVGTLRSRIVAYDDQRVRALMSAAWLTLAGWSEVFVLSAVPSGQLRSGPRHRVSVEVPACDAMVSADELAFLIAGGDAHLVDLASSAEFLASHIPGARFAIRARLSRALARLDPKPHVVLTSPDGLLAQLACPEARPHWQGRISVLAGGSVAWSASGRPLERGFDYDLALEPPEDLWHTPSSFFGGGKPAMQEYIDWETGLTERVRGEPGTNFKLPF